MTMNRSSHAPLDFGVPGLNSDAVAAVYQSMGAALEKHGPPTANPTRMIAILAEEVGEIAEQALKLTSCDPRESGCNCVYRGELRHVGDCPARDHVPLMRAELCQLAAYALLQIHALDTGRG